MTQTILTAGDLSNGTSLLSGNDGTLVLQSGLAGAKVNALSFAADGTPTFLKGPVNVVAFSAYQNSTQSIPNSAFTKLQFLAKEFDTSNAFDSTTNYRFQPTVSGYYQISGCVAFTVGLASQLAIFKNGTAAKNGSSGSTTQFMSVSALIYLNGSSDYVELWAFQAQGSAQNTIVAANNTYFQGILIAKA
jgi:hypothetical protein